MNRKPAVILFDGAVTHNFVSTEFLKKNGWDNKICTESGTIEVGNGQREDSPGYIELFCEIGEYAENARLYAMNLGSSDIILGKPWFYDKNPKVDWKKDEL